MLWGGGAVVLVLLSLMLIRLVPALGVMRFLQTEWHRHERDRNAWDIERAEMKARIARHEGEARTGKRLSELLSTHIRMLEKALKAERETSKALARGDKDAAAAISEGSESGKVKVESLLKGMVLLDGVDRRRSRSRDADANAVLASSIKGKKAAIEDPDNVESIREPKNADEGQMRTFLDKTLQEVTYLMTPPSNPPAPTAQPNQQESLNNHGYSAPANGQGDAKDPYGQPQQSQQQQQRQEMAQTSMHFSQPSPSPNHHPPPVPSVTDVPNLQHQNSSHQSTQMSRSLNDPNPLSQSQSTSHQAGGQAQSGPSTSFPLATEEPIEKYTHTYDSFGRQTASRHDETTSGRSILASPQTPESHVVDTDGWDFDDTKAPEAEPGTIPQRPDVDTFPSANHVGSKASPRLSQSSSRRKGSMSRRRSDGAQEARDLASSQMKADSTNFKVRFALRGHLDVVRSIIFTGGGSPSEPELCTTGDDGVIKRWIIPASYPNFGSQASSPDDLDIRSYFTHRGHSGAVTSLAACPSSQSISSGGRALGDGWIFSGGQDATVRVWERGRVDPKATLDGHTDTIWAICVLPGSCGSVFGSEAHQSGGTERVLLASGSADGTIKIWSVSAPPQLSSPQTGSRRGVGGSRRHSVSSGSGFPSSPQPSTATPTPFNYSLIHTISRNESKSSPTCIAPLSANGDTFVVSYSDAAVIIYDTRNGEEVVGMASLETYDGTPETGVNAVVATTVGLDGSLSTDSGRALSEDESVIHGATGSSGGVEGVVITGHEDRWIRFFDANSGKSLLPIHTLPPQTKHAHSSTGQGTYTMLAHPSAISSLSLSPDGRELVSGGHDASLRFWSLEKRSCTQEITSHRLMRGEGVCSVVWSQDGRWVVSAGGDGVIKVFAR
jgi:striatin 1/3/4